MNHSIGINMSEKTTLPLSVLVTLISFLNKSTRADTRAVVKTLLPGIREISLNRTQSKIIVMELLNCLDQESDSKLASIIPALREEWGQTPRWSDSFTSEEKDNMRDQSTSITKDL